MECGEQMVIFLMLCYVALLFPDPLENIETGTAKNGPVTTLGKLGDYCEVPCRGSKP